MKYAWQRDCLQATEGSKSVDHWALGAPPGQVAGAADMQAVQVQYKEVYHQ